MAVQVQGSGGTVAEVQGTTFRALSVSSKPLEYTTFGHYRYGGFTGILPAALTANSEIFQFRWADASRFAVIQRIKLSACVSTTFFAAGVPVQLDLIKSTGWTVQGTGGTGVTAGATMKKRTTMGSSLLTAGDVRIATTAALGAGTKTLEANSVGAVAAPGPITASLNGQIIAPGTVIYDADSDGSGHPFVLVSNEGLSLRSVAVPATGTWTVGIEIIWAEVAAY